MSPAAVYVLTVARGACVGDWALARWAAAQAVAARAVTLWDDGADVEIAALPEAPEGRMVGAERGEA